MHSKSAILTLLLTVGLLGCSYTIPAGSVECPICKRNGDLACLYVKPDEKAPQVKMKNGYTNYFCSEECKHEFLKKED